MRLRERNKEAIQSIKLVTIGPTKSAETLRTGLAMGADSAVHVEIPDTLIPEPLGVAKALQAVIKRQKEGEAIDLIIMGKQAIDDDASQTGQILAGLLGWGQATFASKVVIADDQKSINVTREIDGGGEEVNVRLPAIVTTDLRWVYLFRATFPLSSPLLIEMVIDGKTYTGPKTVENADGKAINSIIRQIATTSPINDVTSSDMACGLAAKLATDVAPVTAGSSVSLKVCTHLVVPSELCVNITHNSGTLATGPTGLTILAL